MPKRWIFHAGILMLLATLVFSGISCKSKPAVVEDEPPVEAPVQTQTAPSVSQELLNNLKAARDKAAQARQECIDVDGPVYFASDYDPVEAKYNDTGKNVNEGNADSVNQAISAYNDCAASFTDIAQRALPLYAEARVADVAKARQEALDAGAGDYFPGELGIADEKGDEMSSLFDANDYKGSIAAAKIALDYYTALKIGADANTRRTLIIKNDLVRYDEANFDKADTSALAAIDAYAAGDIDATLENVKEAAGLYNQVWLTAWKALATERRDSATQGRKDALDLKANVAVKQEYAEADEVFNQAGKAFQSQGFEEAAGFYEQASSMFVKVSEAARYKRQTAENAIEAADKKVAESEETALAAEEIIQGGAQ